METPEFGIEKDIDFKPGDVCSRKPQLNKMPTLTSVESFSPTTMTGGKVVGISAGVASN